jgi:hypothetical protein
MIELKPPFRYARPDDAAALAELINFAGVGLPNYLSVLLVKDQP